MAETQVINGWRLKFAVLACFLAGAGIPLSLATANIAAGLMVVLFMVTPALWKTIPTVLRQPYVMACLVLYTLMLIGATYTSVPWERAGWMLMKKREFLFAPVLFAVCLVPVARRSILAGFGFGVLISVLASLLVALLNKPFMKASPGDWSVFQTHTYHNYFVALVVCALICAWLAGKIPSRWKIPAALIIAVSAFDVLFLVSGRTGQIIFLLLVTMPFILWQWRKGLLMIAVCAVVIVPMLVFFSSSISNGVKNVQENWKAYQQGNVETSVGLRLEFYRHAVQLIKEKPLIGHGTGSFVHEYQRLTGLKEGWRAAKNPHNDYFWFGVELGSFGILALIGVLASVIAHACRRDLAEKWMAICLSVSMGVATLANSFFVDNLTGLGFALLCCALLAGNSFGPRPERPVA